MPESERVLDYDDIGITAAAFELFWQEWCWRCGDDYCYQMRPRSERGRDDRALIEYCLSSTGDGYARMPSGYVPTEGEDITPFATIRFQKLPGNRQRISLHIRDLPDDDDIDGLFRHVYVSRLGDRDAERIFAEFIAYLQAQNLITVQDVARAARVGAGKGTDNLPLDLYAPLTGPIRDRWALLVGVNRYIDPAFPPLKFCVNDVLALERTLKTLGYTVVTLRDDAPEERLLPTRDNVEAELARLCQVAGPDDLLLAHFACHGKLVDGQPVLITRETRAPTLATKALPLAEVERQMRASQARRLVLTLDACHTGVEIGRDLADPAFIRNAYELAEGFALIAASTAQQVAQEWGEKEHGAFTYYLLEGLSGQADRGGKGFVTADDLKTYALDGLRRWNVEHGGLLQEPTARTEGLGDIILADYRDLPPPAGSFELSGRSNPFGDTGRITDPARFFDREELLRQIFEELTKGANLSLVGESQIGKSSLLSMVCTLGPERLDRMPESFAYLSLEWVDDEDDFYEALCDALHIETCRGYKLTRALRDKRIVLCLDEIEKMTWDGFTVRLRSQLRGLADGPAAPLKLVIASRSALAGIFPDSPELDSPLAGVCRQLDVGPFAPDVARAFLAHRLRGTGVAFTESQINALLQETGGHPAHLQRAAAVLFDRYGRGAR